MTVTVPRAEVDAIREQYDDPWAPWRHGVNPSTAEVRKFALHCRADAINEGRADRGKLLAEADDLDALADRYEKENA